MIVNVQIVFLSQNELIGLLRFYNTHTHTHADRLYLTKEYSKASVVKGSVLFLSLSLNYDRIEQRSFDCATVGKKTIERFRVPKKATVFD